jgi:hypothetical protein
VQSCRKSPSPTGGGSRRNATLKVGATLPSTKAKTAAAVADNNYVNVWNNEAVDASFGVTSAIQLTDVDLSNGKVFRSMQVPTDQVVTSYPSKSELGLHVVNNGTAFRGVGFVE